MTGLLAAVPLARRSCWLFDLDGTLIDSGPAHERAYRVALAELCPAALDDFRYADHLGRPTAEVLAELGAPPAAVARKQALYRRYVDERQVTAVSGAVALLAELAGRGRSLHVVTGASRVSAERALDATGLARFFAGMVAAEDVPAGKPDPAAYREACRRFAPDPGTAVAVEDSPQGVRSALDAGLLTVHIGPGTDGAGPAVAGAGVVAVPGLAALRRLLDGGA